MGLQHMAEEQVFPGLWHSLESVKGVKDVIATLLPEPQGF